MCITAVINAQNIDSQIFISADSSSPAKEIAGEKVPWHLSDTAEGNGFSAVDNYVSGLKKKYKNIPELSKDITRPFYTDGEKVRAIFIWMTQNIVYNEKEKNNPNSSIESGSSYSPAGKWADVYFNYASKVLRSRMGICDGYSALFYELCNYSGIQCEIVKGLAVNDTDKIKKYKNKNKIPLNHAWNKVSINGQWEYIDVTWASSGKYNGRRIEPKGYNPNYYLISENKLYADHVINQKETKKRNEQIGEE